jgi:large subunit ribosomal protein L4
MQVSVLNISGKEVRKTDLPDSVFGIEINEHVIHTVVKGYQANKRQGTHQTKTISFVAGGGKKPFKQKGTGSARQGSSRSPINPGGGILHGPHPRDYRQKMNQSLKRLALRMALSDKARHQKLIVVDDFAISSYSTKHVLKALKSLNANNALLADERKDDFLYKSSRNLHGVATVGTSDLNALNVLSHHHLIISETSLKNLSQRLEG